MTEKKRILIDVTDQFKKYNSMFVNVNLKIFKKRVVVILDDHLDKLHEALEPQLFQKSNRDPGKKQVQNPRTSPGSLK